MARKKKKCPDCPPVGAPAYMLTYGDMMTLLVTFFVLLISFSTIAEVKFVKAISSLKGALGVLRQDQGAMIKRIDTPAFEFKSQQAEMEMEKVIQEVRDVLQKKGLNEQVKFEKYKDRLHFSISSPLLFGTGLANLKNEADFVLDEIGKILALVPFEVRVEGHTDPRPLAAGSQFPSNWELSGARASAVVRKFLDNPELDPSRFMAVGFGPNRPIADNNSAEGMAQNRRVEIFVNLQQDVSKQLLPQDVFEEE